MTTQDNFGPRQVFTQADLTNNQFSQVAASDGFVMAVLGNITYDQAFLGMVAGSTSMNGVVTSAVYASASTQTMTADMGKKGTQTYHLPLPGNFTMPVRAGETWSITLTADAQLAAVPNLTFYWIPDGEASQTALAGTASDTLAAYQALHQKIMAAKA